MPNLKLLFTGKDKGDTSIGKNIYAALGMASEYGYTGGSFEINSANRNAVSQAEVMYDNYVKYDIPAGKMTRDGLGAYEDKSYATKIYEIFKAKGKNGVNEIIKLLESNPISKHQGAAALDLKDGSDFEKWILKAHKDFEAGKDTQGAKFFKDFKIEKTTHGKHTHVSFGTPESDITNQQSYIDFSSSFDEQSNKTDSIDLRKLNYDITLVTPEDTQSSELKKDANFKPINESSTIGLLQNLTGDSDTDWSGTVDNLKGKSWKYKTGTDDYDGRVVFYTDEKGNTRMFANEDAFQRVNGQDVDGPASYAPVLMFNENDPDQLYSMIPELSEITHDTQYMADNWDEEKFNTEIDILANQKAHIEELNNRGIDTPETREVLKAIDARLNWFTAAQENKFITQSPEEWEGDISKVQDLTNQTNELEEGHIKMLQDNVINYFDSMLKADTPFIQNDKKKIRAMISAISEEYKKMFGKEFGEAEYNIVKDFVQGDVVANRYKTEGTWDTNVENVVEDNRWNTKGWFDYGIKRGLSWAWDVVKKTLTDPETAGLTKEEQISAINREILNKHGAKDWPKRLNEINPDTGEKFTVAELVNELSNYKNQSIDKEHNPDHVEVKDEDKYKKDPKIKEYQDGLTSIDNEIEALKDRKKEFINQGRNYDADLVQKEIDAKTAEYNTLEEERQKYDKEVYDIDAELTYDGVAPLEDVWNFDTFMAQVEATGDGDILSAERYEKWQEHPANEAYKNKGYQSYLDDVFIAKHKLGSLDDATNDQLQSFYKDRHDTFLSSDGKFVFKDLDTKDGYETFITEDKDGDGTPDNDPNDYAKNLGSSKWWMGYDNYSTTRLFGDADDGEERDGYTWSASGGKWVKDGTEEHQGFFSPLDPQKTVDGLNFEKENWIDKIGGPGSIVSAITGGLAIPAIFKDVDVTDYPELSHAFEEHYKQSEKLSQEGFSAAEEGAIRDDIDQAYKLGVDNIVRGTAGDRAKFLAMSGAVDAQRAKNLLDFAAADAQLQRQNFAKHTEMVNWKESYEANKTLDQRNIELQQELAKKEAAGTLAAESVSSILSNIRDRQTNGPNSIQGMTNKAYITAATGQDYTTEKENFNMGNKLQRQHNRGKEISYDENGVMVGNKVVPWNRYYNIDPDGQYTLPADQNQYYNIEETEPW